jgi:hypothetical protein
MSEKTVFASAARTATPTAVVLNTGRVKGLQLVIDVTAVTSTPSVVFTVEVVDSLSGKFIALLTTAAIATVSTTVLNLGQGVVAAAGLAVGAVIPENVRISATHGNANSITYSVSAHLIR